MATNAEIKKAVDDCNKAMERIDSGISGGINDLVEVDHLKKIAGELHKSWETKNGEATMIELFKVLDSLKTQTESIKRAVDNIKNDKYTYTTRKEEEIIYEY